MRSVGSSHADPFVDHRRGHRRSFRPAARRRQRRSAAHARRNRLQGSHSGLHRDQVKDGKRKLMGFGHRVYKNYDPRARIIKRVAEEVFEVTGRNPKIDIALELERIALTTNTSSSASSIPTSISTPASSIRPWASLPISSPSCSAFRAPWAGWRNGRRWCRMANEDCPSTADVHRRRSARFRAHRRPRRAAVGERVGVWARSELQPERVLNLAAAIALRLLSRPAKQSIPDRQIGIGPHQRIGRVIGFQPEFHFVSFPNRKDLRHGRVHVPHDRSRDAVVLIRIGPRSEGRQHTKCSSR